MQFNSFTFLGFFSVLVAIYYALPPRLRWPLLLVASYYFYSQFRPGYVLLLAYSTFAAYGFGRVLEGRKAKLDAGKLLAVAICAQLIVLVVFKYVDFLSDTLVSALTPVMRHGNALALPRLGWLLPVGLSFFSFSAISYVVDVYRGVIPAERHLGRLALYIAFFPKLVAGPIERAGPFLAQVTDGVRFALPTFTFGLQLLLWGLFKKVVIADRLVDFVSAGFTDPSFQSPITLVIAVYFYAFQIYCDFSGYSDMAIGLAAMLGYQLMENFRRPYFSRSVAEFWSQRWHISLVRWFRDYLYIPLGGNRVSRPRWYANQMIVFLISGLWHGANLTFIIWGGLNGFYQVVYYMLGGARKAAAVSLPSVLWNVLGILLTFHLVLFSWIFFRAESVDQAWTVVIRIWANLPILPVLIGAYSWTAPFRVAVGLIVVLLLVEAVDEFYGLWSWLARRPIGLRWGFYYALLACLVILGQWGMSKFVYMQF